MWSTGIGKSNADTCGKVLRQAESQLEGRKTWGIYSYFSNIPGEKKKHAVNSF